ncbi:alpha/beta hydrolase [Halobacillus sp. ACCC02827]|uniref:alpha/beta hydrolase n=1 Tax=Halobacillus sp. ACCC02827 TaxID=3052090 RepID=UPI00257036DE|nr:alpha/beta fold hydrolase [Halobacillus sp. ACCC02827]WJE15129.1 alpha/beta hydrolase [Halobacillus sp. ACCC02827]
MTKIQEAVIERKGTKLYGTLTLPDPHSKKAVLLIPGSGKVDRDGNGGWMQADIYKELAGRLHEAGLITLRYDKRGVGKSEGSYVAAGLWDFIEDAGDWLEFLKGRSEVEEVTVIGHSEGAIIGPAVMRDRSADRFIFLCGSFDKGEELLDYQNRMIRQEIAEASGVKGFFFRVLKVNKKIEKQTRKFYEKIEADPSDVIQYKGTKINAKWVREMRAFDTADYLSYVPARSLAIEGEKDVQVKQGSARAFASHTGAEVKVYPDMNHLLRKRSGNHTLLNVKKEYKESIRKDEMHPDMLRDLIQFLQS